MRRKVVPLLISVAYLAVVAGVGTSFSRYSKAVDLAILCVYFAIAVILSIAVAREKWRAWHRQQSGETILRRWRRWVTDDPGAAANSN